MEITITKRLRERYPDVRFIAVIAKGLVNQKRSQRLEDEKSRIEQDIKKKIKDPSSLELVKGYNLFFNKFEKTVPIEYQLKSILGDKKIPPENTLKDILFMAEMKHYCMVSGQDLDQIDGDMCFDLSDGKETYVTISSKAQKLRPDDIVLRKGKEVLISLLFGPGYADRITDKTRDCVYLFWFFSKADKEKTDMIIEDFRDSLAFISDDSTSIEVAEVMDAAGAHKVIDPWGSTLIDDYNKLISDFHLEVFDPHLFPEPNRLMRRGVTFSGIDLKVISDAIREKRPFYVLSGIMPSGKKIHFGTKMVVEMISYFQKHGGETYILVADLEAEATREISLAEARNRALEFHIPAYVALGLDPRKTTFYFQSDNIDVMHAAYKYSKKVTLSQFQALYGNAEPERIFAALTQVGDILYPQFAKRMPGVIPVGVDQCPHILLTRDIVNRMKSEKFFPPAATFHKYTPALNGDFKMSKSMPESMIELPEDPKTACQKIKRALTGGRDTLEEHRRLGAVIEKDMVFELMKQHLIEDDDELDHIYKEYRSGRMTSGELKEIACRKITEFMVGLEKGIEDARKNLPSLKFIRPKG